MAAEEVNPNGKKNPLPERELIEGSYKK